MVQEGSLSQGQRVSRGHDPVGDLIGDAEPHGGRSVAEVLVPHHAADGTAARRGQASRHVEDDEDLLLLHRRERPLGDLGEQDQGGPLRRLAELLSGDEGEIDGGRHHDEANEKGPEDGAQVETVLELGGNIE